MKSKLKQLQDKGLALMDKHIANPSDNKIKAKLDKVDSKIQQIYNQQGSDKR